MFYNKLFSSNYKELLTYYPRYYREVREMDAILNTNGEIADCLEDNIERVFNNCFIDRADEETLSRLEKFLHLEIYSNRNVEDRRQLIKAYLIGTGKMSGTKIEMIIQAFTGVLPEIDFTTEYFIIMIPLKTAGKFYVSDLKNLIGKRMPAHLAYYFSFRVENITPLESFKLRTISRMPVYWFTARGILNGAFFLDGNQLLNTEIKLYMMRTCHYIKIVNLKKILIEKINTLFLIISKAKIYFTYVNKFNFYCLEKIKGKKSIRSKIYNQEGFSAPMITYTHNLWHLDNVIPLDGRQTLDAYQIKEVLE